MESKILVEIYSKDDCCLCDDVMVTVKKISKILPFRFEEVDITKSEDLNRRYFEEVPTIFINGKKSFKFRIDEEQFRKKILREIVSIGLTRKNN